MTSGSQDMDFAHFGLSLLTNITRESVMEGKKNRDHPILPSLSFNAFLPYILQPTRIINYSNTFVDNIFLNDIDPDIISGNLAAPISDHLPQYAIIPNMFGNISGNKSNIYERD